MFLVLDGSLLLSTRAETHFTHEPSSDDCGKWPDLDNEGDGGQLLREPESIYALAKGT